MCDDLNKAFYSETYTNELVKTLDPSGKCELEAASPLLHGPIRDEEFIVRAIDFPQSFDAKFFPTVVFNHLNFASQAFDLQKGKGASSQRFLDGTLDHRKKLHKIFRSRDIEAGSTKPKPRKVLGYVKQQASKIRSLSSSSATNEKQTRIYNTSNNSESNEHHCDIFVFLEFPENIPGRKGLIMEQKIAFMDAFFRHGQVFIYNDTEDVADIKSNFPVDFESVDF